MYRPRRIGDGATFRRIAYKEEHLLNNDADILISFTTERYRSAVIASAAKQSSDSRDRMDWLVAPRHAKSGAKF
jgi:hypothetical protein